MPADTEDLSVEECTGFILHEDQYIQCLRRQAWHRSRRRGSSFRYKLNHVKGQHECVFVVVVVVVVVVVALSPYPLLAVAGALVVVVVVVVVGLVPSSAPHSIFAIAGTIPRSRTADRGPATWRSPEPLMCLTVRF